MMMTMMMQGVRQRVEKLQGTPMAANTINHHRTRIGERSYEITPPPPPQEEKHNTTQNQTMTTTAQQSYIKPQWSPVMMTMTMTMIIMATILL